MAPRLMSKPLQTAGQAANIAVILFFPSALVLGALALPFGSARASTGSALGVALIAGSMTNLIVLSRGSRVAFASGHALALYLLVMPLMDVGRVSSPLLATMMIAVGLIMLNIIGAKGDRDRPQGAGRGRREGRRRAPRRRPKRPSRPSRPTWRHYHATTARRSAPSCRRRAEPAQRDGARGRLQGPATLISDGDMMRTLLNDPLDLSNDGGRADGWSSRPVRPARGDGRIPSRMWRPHA